MILFTGTLIAIKKEAKANMERAEKGLKVHNNSKSRYSARNEQITNAMKMINHPDENQRWSIEHFLQEMSLSQVDVGRLETIDKGM